MANRITGRDSVALGIRLIIPPVEIREPDFEAACLWLDDASRSGYYHAEVTAEGDVRTAMFFISDPAVYSLFRRVWGIGAQTLH